MLNEVLLRALGLHEGAGYALEGEISERKLVAAREAMEIPPEERVLALLDTTLLGSGRAGLAVGERGLYFVSNGFGARVHHLTWGQFLRETMVMDDELGYVQLGAGRAVYPSLRPGLGMFTTARIYALLMDLRTTLRLAQREGLLADALAEESAPPAALIAVLSHAGPKRMGRLVLPESARARPHQHLARANETTRLGFKAGQGLLDLRPRVGAFVFAQARQHLVQGSEGLALETHALGSRGKVHGGIDPAHLHVPKTRLLQRLRQHALSAQGERPRLPWQGRRQLRAAPDDANRHGKEGVALGG